MPTTHLNARNVRSLPSEGGGRLDYWDDTLPGFCLRVSPSGVRTYAVWYRVNGEARRYTIGRLDTIDLATARQRAREVLANAKLHGKDANEEKNEARRRATVGDDFRLWRTSFCRGTDPTFAPERSRSSGGLWKPTSSPSWVTLGPARSSVARSGLSLVGLPSEPQRRRIGRLRSYGGSSPGR